MNYLAAAPAVPRSPDLYPAKRTAARRADLRRRILAARETPAAVAAREAYLVRADLRRRVLASLAVRPDSPPAAFYRDPR